MLLLLSKVSLGVFPIFIVTASCFKLSQYRFYVNIVCNCKHQCVCAYVLACSVHVLALTEVLYLKEHTEIT